MSDIHAHRPAPRHYRSLFLSDLHLGAIGSRADLLLDFLQRHQADSYLLVGDILDIWHPVLPHWSATHQAVIDHLRARQQAGAKLVYIRGNHDPQPDTAPPEKRLSAEPLVQTLHQTADGRRYLVLHGDAQDTRLFRAHIMTRIGSRIDGALRQLDRRLGQSARRAEAHKRSAIEQLLAVVNLMFYPGRAHERRLVALARAEGVDGVICGHFHKAGLHDRHGLIYANCGDWMDSFTGLAEDFDGSLRVLGGRVALAEERRPVMAGEVARA